MNVLQAVQDLLDSDAPAGGARLVDRRRLLMGGVLAAMLGEKPSIAGTAPPVSNTHLLVRRLTMGLTQAELAQANSLGYDGYLQWQLNYNSIDDSALQARLAGYTTLSMEPNQLIQQSPYYIPYELREAAIIRAVYSRRQLFERMVEFWTDHFNIDAGFGMGPFLKAYDDRTVIRPNALGSFPALLSASAHSPAMLHYLGNVASVAGNPNENYARELMELHTLGVDGGYTQQDIVEVARCFTGWTTYPLSMTDPNTLRFRFDPSMHDNGPKVVLGNVIPAGGGIADGEMVLNILATHPATANHLAIKICRWFHSESPPAALVSRVAEVYRTTGGNIRDMVETIFTRAEILTAPLKFKRPFHLFVSAMRATDLTITATDEIQTRLIQCGHVPFNWVAPNGFPDTFEYWSSLLLPRWSFGAELAANYLSNASFNLSKFYSGTTTIDQMVDRLDQSFFCGAMPTAQKNIMKDYLTPAPMGVRRIALVGLSIGCPAFQWY